MYDPTLADLSQLLGDACFPAQGAFRAPKVLEALRALGLKSALSRATILDVLVGIASGGAGAGPGDASSASGGGTASAALEQHQGGAQRARLLLRYLNRHVTGLLGSACNAGAAGAGDVQPPAFVEKLRSLPWLPVVPRAPDALTPWLRDASVGAGAGAEEKSATTSKPAAKFFAPPSRTRPPSEALFCSATHFVLDMAIDIGSGSGSANNNSNNNSRTGSGANDGVFLPSAELRAALGWDNPLPLSAITEQLRVLSELHAEFAASASSASASGSSEPVARALIHERVTQVVPQLYSLLAARLGLVANKSTTADGSKMQQQSDSLAQVQTALQGVRWFWVAPRQVVATFPGPEASASAAAIAPTETFSSSSASAERWGLFAPAQKVALRSDLDVHPYLVACGPELLVFADLFRALGVRAALSPLDYVSVISFIASQHSTAASGAAAAPSSSTSSSTSSASPPLSPSTPLNSRELSMCIAILQYLSDRSGGGSSGSSGGGTEGGSINLASQSLYIPDTEGVLRLPRDIVFNDAPWLSAKTLGDISAQVRFIHPKLSSDVARVLGVRSLRQHMLFLNSSNLADSSAAPPDVLKKIGTARAYGQSEPITRRLKSILANYVEGPGILFELIQNADDAGATEVKFMLNLAQYKTASLLSATMEEWQGPALYAYNNAVFQEKDFYSLSQIGQSSKVDKMSATGR